MRNMRGWIWTIPLAVACAWMATGCSDDGDDDGAVPGTTTVVVTNTVNGTTHTNTVVVTNAPAADEGDGGSGDTEDPMPALRLMAPALVSPADGASYSTLTPAIAYSVKMEWAAVSGAATYVIEVDGTKYVTDGLSKTMGFAVGTHTWSVYARTASNVDGWPSGTFSFTIRQQMFTP